MTLNVVSEGLPSYIDILEESNSDFPKLSHYSTRINTIRRVATNDFVFEDYVTCSIKGETASNFRYRYQVAQDSRTALSSK